MHKCQEENVNLPGAKEAPRIHSLAAVQRYKIEIMACWKMAISLLETLLLCKCQGSTSGRGTASPPRRQRQRGSAPVPASRGLAGSGRHALPQFGGDSGPPRRLWPPPKRPSPCRHPLGAAPARTPAAPEGQRAHGEAGLQGRGGGWKPPWPVSRRWPAVLGTSAARRSWTWRDPGVSFISN